ncbi:LysE family translocator [Pleomorphomonas diazotrophica]|uniref:LysE family translocator n=1 Tax=Pleomorphomonas diazotrophica TaxID=1166257 RepID=A0A1I4SE01_9HYPH|nr:LysE family translocator [Pleomorphomonas diazotrophica]PKR89048.1 LysE family translocator [Pleomorphomonas diazotrophica]SFM62561.1 Threonine/homoserine/homoserine lactone efflux protein [Pleomorphomonas diazotrophica]
MLGYDWAHWATFFVAAFLLNVSPGPDIAFILGHTARGGRRQGLAAMFGLWAGAFCHVVFAAVGLSAIVATSATAFSLVKWAGVAYLAFLGISALRSKASAFDVKATPVESRLSAVFLQGMLVDILNPKVAIFFLAFLPQFVVDGAGPVPLQLLLHGALIIVVAATVEPLVVLGGAWLTARLRASNRLALWLDRSLGALFLGLAAKLAALQR